MEIFLYQQMYLAKKGSVPNGILNHLPSTGLGSLLLVAQGEGFSLQGSGAKS